MCEHMPSLVLTHANQALPAFHAIPLGIVCVWYMHQGPPQAQCPRLSLSFQKQSSPANGIARTTPYHVIWQRVLRRLKDGFFTTEMITGRCVE